MAAASAAVAAPPKAKNGYYYWHGHGKERKEVGDVAPLPTHVPLATEVETPASPSQVVSQIQKYSWCNNKTSVSVYVDCEDATESNTAVSISATALEVRVTLPGTVMQLALPLAKECNPEASSFKFKPNQVVIKLAKAKDDETWFDLVSKA